MIATIFRSLCLISTGFCLGLVAFALLSIAKDEEIE